MEACFSMTVACRRLRRVATLATVLAATALAGTSATAAADNVGYRDGSFDGTSEPTGSKRAESAVWWNDGYWWGNMWDPVSRDFHIFRFNPAFQTWTDTGVTLDTLNATNADTLWDGTHLY